MSRAQVATVGLGVPEGPVVHADGTVSFTEQVRGRLTRWADGRLQEIAVTGGGPNSHAAGSDGCLYVAQNGGMVGAWRSSDPRPPGVQRVHPDGRVEAVAGDAGGRPLLAPNDLVFGPDGWLWLTDPAHAFDPVRRGAPGRLVRLGPDGAREDVVAVGTAYCNGLAFDPSGRLLWVESYDRAVCFLDEERGRVELVRLPAGHTPDGMAVATDGRLFIATCESHGITVLAPDGEVLDLLVLDEDALVTNCAFAPDGALWVTDFGMDWPDREAAGRLWRLETDAVGLPVGTGSLSRCASAEAT